MNDINKIESGVAFVEPARACWFFHDWSKWVDYNRPLEHYLNSKSIGVGCELRQRRRCLNCGFIQDKAVRRD